MTETSLRLDERELHTRLTPMLRGRAFHVTCASNIAAITVAGAILPNADGVRPSSFGSSSRSFFRLRGCVSIFDYRQVDEATPEETLGRCAPWNAARSCSYQLGIYFLSADACAVLENWTLWQEQEAWGQMIVPYVEAGHPGAIPLTSIEELLAVTIDHQPHPLEVALEKMHERRRRDQR